MKWRMQDLKVVILFRDFIILWQMQACRHRPILLRVSRLGFMLLLSNWCPFFPLGSRTCPYPMTLRMPDPLREWNQKIVATLIFFFEQNNSVMDALGWLCWLSSSHKMYSWCWISSTHYCVIRDQWAGSVRSKKNKRKIIFSGSSFSLFSFLVLFTSVSSFISFLAVCFIAIKLPAVCFHNLHVHVYCCHHRTDEMSKYAIGRGREGKLASCIEACIICFVS